MLIQRLSEVCCSAVTQILMLGKSIISDGNKTQSPDEDVDEIDMVKINWPEDSIEKAKIIRARAELLTASVEAVCSSFTTGRVVTDFNSFFSLTCNFFMFLVFQSFASRAVRDF